MKTTTAKKIHCAGVSSVTAHLARGARSKRNGLRRAQSWLAVRGPSFMRFAVFPGAAEQCGGGSFLAAAERQRHVFGFFLHFGRRRGLVRLAEVEVGRRRLVSVRLRMRCRSVLALGSRATRRARWLG